MHHKIRKVVRYTIWSVLGIILAILLFGALSYEGTLRDYVDFLNERDRSQATTQVSAANPLSWPYLLLPTDNEVPQDGEIAIMLDEQQDQTNTDIDGFFADFEANIDIQDEDFFGFATQTGSMQTGAVLSGDAQGLTDAQKEQLLELFRARERRIQAQQEFELSQQQLSGDTQTGATQEDIQE